MSFEEKIMGGNKIKNVPIISEAKLRRMSQFSIKVYVGNTTPNHPLMMMGHCQNTFFWPCLNDIVIHIANCSVVRAQVELCPEPEPLRFNGPQNIGYRQKALVIAKMINAL